MNADYKFTDAEGSRHLEEGCRVFCLKTGFVGDGCHVCLILRSLDEEQTVLERVGLLQWTPMDAVDSWYKDG